MMQLIKKFKQSGFLKNRRNKISCSELCYELGLSVPSPSQHRQDKWEQMNKHHSFCLLNHLSICFLASFRYYAFEYPHICMYTKASELETHCRRQMDSWCGTWNLRRKRPRTCSEYDVLAGNKTADRHETEITTNWIALKIRSHV